MHALINMENLAELQKAYVDSINAISGLIAERDRYKGALERIRDEPQAKRHCCRCHAPIKKCTCSRPVGHEADCPARIAAEALAAQPGERG